MARFTTGFFDRKLKRILALKDLQEQKLNSLKDREKFLKERFCKDMASIENDKKECFKKLNNLYSAINDIKLKSLFEKNSTMKNS